MNFRSPFLELKYSDAVSEPMNVPRPCNAPAVRAWATHHPSVFRTVSARHTP